MTNGVTHALLTPELPFVSADGRPLDSIPAELQQPTEPVVPAQEEPVADPSAEPASSEPPTPDEQESHPSESLISETNEVESPVVTTEHTEHDTAELADHGESHE
jgi:outer membrane biosynthesis protein TonB